MQKNMLIGTSIVAVILLVLVSLSNVVGYQTVKSLNPQFIDEQESKEKTQSPNSECGCGDSSGTTEWKFPVICSMLGAIVLFFLFLSLTINIGENIAKAAFILGQTLNCWP